MRLHRSIGLATAGLVGVLGLPAIAAADTPTTLYVNNNDLSKCSDSGQGTQALPFCGITAAEKIVTAGQTILVTGEFSDPVTIDHSGEQGNPITIRNNGRAAAYIAGGDAKTRGLSLSGVHDVVVQGLGVDNGTEVSNTARVTIDQQISGSVQVDGTSTDVTVSRSTVDSIAVRQGPTGTRIVRNVINKWNPSGTILIDGAPHTTITGNTVNGGCGAGITLADGSSNSGIFNNTVAARATACGSGTAGPDVVVGADSNPGTLADYNAYQTNLGSSPYNWNSQGYQTQADFTAGTSQGAHDLVVTSGPFGAVEGSPTVDSADVNAPGVMVNDVYGNPPVDDPKVPNTGTGSGVMDRGAIELQDQVSDVRLSLDQTQAPYGTVITAKATATDNWPSTLTYRFDFGDGTAPVTTSSPTATHTYTAACQCTVSLTAVTSGGWQQPGNSVPETVTTPGPIVPKFTVTAPVPNSSDPISRIAPLSIDVNAQGTVSPWPIAGYTVDYGDGSQPETHNTGDWWLFGHRYATPGDYTVKLTVKDSQGNTASSTQPAHVAYAPSGFLPIAPYRVFDSRTKYYGGHISGDTVAIPIGVAATPVTSGSISSVVLNVTVTDVTESAHLTVWPAGQHEPTTSSLNVVAGRTTSNLVTLPLGLNDSVALHLNSGYASIIVDVVGYYQPGIGDRFSPLTPTRLVDTRNGDTGGKLGADTTRTIKIAGTGGVPATATAVVLNMTGTNATDDTFLTAFPGGTARPTTSNLNPAPGQDRGSQVIVPLGKDGTINVYNHVGATDMVLDVSGYYGPDGKNLFTPTVPVRLLDTRTTGTKPIWDSITQVSGVPAGATAAVLNVTATDTTDSSYLSVFADGTPRPGTSNLNFGPGQTVPNHVTTPVSADGKIDIYNHVGTTDIIADLFGYFTAA